MHTLTRIAHEGGGLIPTFRLRAAGFSPHLIAELCRDGALIRVRQGWYAEPGMPEAALRAARVGGQATCHDALRDHGVWVIPDARLHVALGAHAVRPRHPDDHRRRLEPEHSSVVLHWRREADAVQRPVATVGDALSDLERCASREAFAVALDSALHKGVISLDSEIAQRHRSAGLDGVCESGIETLVWMRLRRLRKSIRRQVLIPGVGRVDFLIGDRLVVEVDGRAHHTGAEAFERDRRRDALLAQRGYRVLRFSYGQVVHEWRLVEHTILTVMARGEHRANVRRQQR